jgi:DNA repair exonuclease SbcCD nuclease subunit
MENILIVGDPHFMKHNSYETDQLKNEIEKLYNQHQIEYTVILGDVLDGFGEIKMLPYNRAIEFLEICQERSKHLFIIVGNHDRINQVDFLTTKSSLRALKKWPNTTVVDIPLSYTFKCGKRALFVPYVYPGRFLEALKEYSFNIEDFDIVFSHQEYGGIKLDNGPISESKDVYLSTYPLCFNGHIHTYSKNNNLINVGTPYNKDFGDTIESKSVMMLELDKLNYERIFLNIRKKKTVIIEFNNLEQFILEDNCLTRLTIRGDASVIMSSHLYINLVKNENVNIIIEDTRPSIKHITNISTERTDFYQEFMKKLKKEKLLKFYKQM